MNEEKYRSIGENGRILGMKLFRKEVMCGYMNEVLGMLDENVLNDGIKESMEYCGVEFVGRYRYSLLRSEVKCDCLSCKELK